VEYQPIFAKYGYGTTIWSPLASGLLTGKYSGGVFPEGSRLAHAQNAWLKAQLVDGEDGGGNGLNGLEVQEPKAALAMADKLGPIAAKLGCTQAQLALAWCLNNADVSTVITGASRVEQVDENFVAMKVLKLLTSEVMAEIDTALGNKPTRPKDWGRGRERLF
jgi:aryl-alcohol dehydrogenase-like predicted oxidoreductase